MYPQQSINDGDDFNSFDSIGLYSVNINPGEGNIVNYPNNDTWKAGTLVVLSGTTNGGGYLKVQIYFSRGRTTATYQRSRWATNWSPWEEISVSIPSFYKNYSTLAELWSGLAYATTEMSDCNNAPLGIGLVTSNTQNIPASATMIVLTLGNSSGHKGQLCFRATGYLFYRGYAGGVWSAWKEISMT